MKQYAEYKDSGIPWIEKIPSKWEKTKIGFCYTSQLGKMLQPNPINTTDTLEAYLCAANINKSGVSAEPRKEMWFSDIEKKTYDVHIGDLLAVEGGDVGLACIYTKEEPTYIQNAIHRIRGNDRFSNRYLAYWLEFLKSRGYMDLVCNRATIAHYTKDKLLNSPLVIPAFEAQKQIVDYLDRKTAAIDAVIADKEKQISLLQEKRTAIISKAVTKGLGSTVPMKDSGVEWIGQIPQHWSVSRIGFETWVRARLGWKGLKADEYVDDGYIFLATPNIKTAKIDFENVNYITKERYDESPEIKLQVGDVLLAKDGSTLGTVNVIRYLPQAATVNSSLAVITPYKNIDSLYLFYLWQSDYMKNLIKQKKGGMGVPHLFQGDIVKFKIPLPPKSEQKVIVDYVETQLLKVDALLDDMAQQIERLKEYRQSVISEVVTGKVMVEA